MEDETTIKISLEDQTLTVIAKKGERGERGEDGQDADEEEIIERVLPVVLEKVPTAEDVAKLIPTPENGKDGRDGKDGIDAIGEKGEKGDKGDKGDDGKDGSPDTAEQVKDKLLSVGIKYDEIQDTPDIPQIVRNLSSKTVSLSELDDVNLDGLTQTNGKYNLGSGGGGIESIVAGNNITVDDADPANPIVSAIAGDRYKTTSTTSHTIVSGGDLTFTVDAGLSYTVHQDVTIAHNASNFMSGEVVSYSGTTLVVAIKHKTGSGTYSSWTINLDGIPIEAITGATDSTLTQTGATLGLNLANENDWTGEQTFPRIGLGTTTPRNTRLDVIAPTITLVTGTGTITPTQIVDDCVVNGTGTLFLSEVRVGDLITNTAGNLASMVTRIASNTQLFVIGLGVGFMGANSSYRIVRRIASTEDSNGITSWAEANPSAYNAQSGAMDYHGHFFGGGYAFFANRAVPNLGVFIKQSAADGRMQMGHVQSTAYLQFQAGNANITAERLTIQGNSTWAMPFYLGLSGYSGNQTGLFLDRSGIGTGQTIFLQTRIFAVNGDAPKLQVGVNGLDIGRRDGSAWNEGIDAITLSMGKTSGNWKFGSFGTSTPTEATSRVHIVEANGYQQLRLETPYTPTSTADTNGNVGDIAWDDNYTYVKTSTGWKRSALSTF
jgi:hypothetical protein